MLINQEAVKLHNIPDSDEHDVALALELTTLSMISGQTNHHVNMS